MPFDAIEPYLPRPGIYTNGSPGMSDGRWVDGNNVRFRNGNPEPIGGWDATSISTLTGKAREMFYNERVDGSAVYLGIGTHSHLYFTDGTTTIDATPTSSFTAGADDQSGRADASQWVLSPWGEDFICHYRDGSTYLWDASAGLSGGNVATVISQVPTCRHLISNPENRVLIALGANDGTNDDPMLIRWCDREDFTTWTAADGNQAGDKRLDEGKRIITALHTRGEILIFTDTALYTMSTIGGTFEFAFRSEGQTVRIAGPKAGVDWGGTVYFMGVKSFYMWNGALQEMPCDVQKTVFDDADTKLNVNQSSKVFCMTNRLYDEVWWFYPSGTSTECDRYVAYNRGDQTWFFGSLARTAMLDEHPLSNSPFAIAPDGISYEHETTRNADGAALSYHLTTHAFKGPRGADLFTQYQELDFREIEGTVKVEILQKKKRKEGQSTTTKGPRSYTSSKRFSNMRARGKELQFKIYGDSVGSYMELAGMYVGFDPAGLRG